MKVLKWSSIALASILGMIFLIYLYMIFTAPKPEDLIQYKTKNHAFSIPYRFVVPGTLPSGITPAGYDTDGPDIFIWFEGEYVKDHIPSFKIKGGVNSQYFRNLHISLTDGEKSELNQLWASKKRIDAITLSGDFQDGYVEYVNELGLYRVFREYEGKKLGGFWDLTILKPSVDNKIDGSYKGKWVGSCYKNADNVETSCSFIIDVLGLYADISAAEDDYLRLEEIKKMVSAHLEGWVEPAM